MQSEAWRAGHAGCNNKEHPINTTSLHPAGPWLWAALSDAMAAAATTDTAADAAASKFQFSSLLSLLFKCLDLLL